MTTQQWISKEQIKQMLGARLNFQLGWNSYSITTSPPSRTSCDSDAELDEMMEEMEMMASEVADEVWMDGRKYQFHQKAGMLGYLTQNIDGWWCWQSSM